MPSADMHTGEIISAIERLDLGEIRLMEVCGTHTMSIAKSGLRSMLPKNIKLLSGPGCPVCVTPPEVIDAVLELATSEYLYQNYPTMPEGEATRTRASIVCEQTLALCARDLGLGECLRLGTGEELTGGRDRDSITSDAMEALLGAIYLDGGFANAKEFVHHFILNDIEHKKLFYDSKTILQEQIQSETEEPIHYELVKEEGPDHNKRFTVNVVLGEKVLGSGSGRTKKAAEQEAAYRALLTRKVRG